MGTVNLATAKAQLSELIYRAESGEEILVTRHGQPEKPVASRAAFRASLPGWSQDSATLIRAMRDEGRRPCITSIPVEMNNKGRIAIRPYERQKHVRSNRRASPSQHSFEGI